MRFLRWREAAVGCSAFAASARPKPAPAQAVEVKKERRVIIDLTKTLATHEVQGNSRAEINL